MSAVYVSNLIINAGSTFSQSFDLGSTEDNAPFNLSGYTIAAQLRKHSASSTATDFESVIVDSDNGLINVALAATTTAAIKPGRYVYDIVVTTGDIKTRVVEGSALVREGVTQ